jgi:primosomal protein N'
MNENEPVESSANMRKIVVKGHYTYLAPEEWDIQIGDIVILPPGASRRRWQGEVTGFESSYDGPIKQVIGLIKKGGHGHT